MTNVEVQASQSRVVRLAPWLSRFVMGPPLAVFAVLSIRYFTDPAHATAGTTLNSPEAFTDTRVLGAWVLTLLVLLITSIVSKKRIWLGHLQLAFFMGATLVVRVYGFLHDGTTLAMGNQRIITVVEVVFLILNTGALVLQRFLHFQERKLQAQ